MQKSNQNKKRSSAAFAQRHVVSMIESAISAVSKRDDSIDSLRRRLRTAAAEDQTFWAVGRLAVFTDEVDDEPDKVCDCTGVSTKFKFIQAVTLYETSFSRIRPLLTIRSELQALQKRVLSAEEQIKLIRMESELQRSCFIAGHFASCLENSCNDYARAEDLYLTILEARPLDEFAIGAYAMYLYRVKRDFDQAERYFYLRCLYGVVSCSCRCFRGAVTTHPGQASIKVKYANFLKSIRGDMDGAERYAIYACISIHCWSIRCSVRGGAGRRRRFAGSVCASH